MFSSEKNVDILKKAFDVYTKEYVETLPEENTIDCENFSDKFEKKMEKLIKQQKSFYFSYINSFGKRVACIVLILCISLFATVFSVEALREPFVKFIVETYNKFTSIFIEEENINLDDDFRFEIITPEFIPDDFKSNSPSTTETGYMCMYIDSKGNYFVYTQDLYDGWQTTIDTENITYEKLYINSLEAIYYENKGLNCIVFSNDYYTFNISGYISKETIIQIAESIKIN